MADDEGNLEEDKPSKKLDLNGENNVYGENFASQPRSSNECTVFTSTKKESVKVPNNVTNENKNEKTGRSSTRITTTRNINSSSLWRKKCPDVKKSVKDFSRNHTNRSNSSHSRGFSSKLVSNEATSTKVCVLEQKSDQKKTTSRNKGISNKCTERNKYISFAKLEMLSSKSPEEIVFTLCNERSELQSLLNRELSSDYIVLIVKVISRLCESTFNDSKSQLLIMFCQTFLQKLTLYLNSLLVQDSADKNRNKYFWNRSDEFWDNVLMFYENVIAVTPNTAIERLPKVIKTTLLTVNNIEICQNLHVEERIKVKLQYLEKKIELRIKEFEQNKVKHSGQEEKHPMDNFRDIPVFPCVNELMSFKRGFVRKNIVKGKYDSVEHYLDVQFRLLREDFLGPLRTGICTYKNQSSGERKKIFGVRIYPRVLFIGKKIIRDQVATLVQFHLEPKKMKIKWEQSKSFLFGSLLCFTKNNFQDIIFGTVACSDIELLQKGQVGVFLKNEFTEEGYYVMVESTVFFDPYNYVLQSLKSLDEENFPMRRYIVDVISDVLPPSYLSAENVYTFVDVDFVPLQKETWPSCDKLCLDESQYLALQAALSREFCVIQGPPGTGKTYIGLQITQILLENISLPILVICYTNHALDQFLEGISKFTKSIIRIGGQCKNDNIKKFNINVARERTELFELRIEKKRVLKKISVVLAALDNIKNKDIVFSFKYFNEIDNMFENSWFETSSQNEQLEWLLGARKSVKNSQLKVSSFEPDDKDIDVDAFFMDDDAEKNRIIDDDFLDSVDSDSHKYISIFNISEKRAESRKIAALLESMERGEVSCDGMFSLVAKLNKMLDEIEYLQMRLGNYTYVNNRRPPVHVNYRYPHLMSANDRWDLYYYWIDELVDKLKRNLNDLESEHAKYSKMYEELKQIKDLVILKSQEIIGMTTSGAAKYQATLRALKCPIVIIEEAAEVLEAHIVVSMTKECKHVILIGDHQQLRPSTAEFHIAKEYNLEVSLFERMLQNGVDCVQLKVQHRMRPEIAQLIVPAIYKTLDNHATVFNYPNIRGVDKNVFFVTHNSPEEDASYTNSKRNISEAKYLIKLARYLILQGYEPSEITILTTYTGQMYYLFQERSSIPLLKGVRITVVDNFQGEENKIILLSLVRSNNSDNIGFLKIDNRVCVALSRAKEGLFIIGNMNILEKSHNVWPKVKNVLEEQKAIDTHLPLRCQIHTEQVTKVAVGDDFLGVPEGGCTKICDRVLICGHKCTSFCHIIDRNHEIYTCKEPCDKILCDLQHKCPKTCYEKCGPCKVRRMFELPCKHTHQLECFWSTQLEIYRCMTNVSVTLKCEHTAKKPCYQPINEFVCPHKCDIRLECGHSCPKKCHVDSDPDHLQYQCEKECEKLRKDCTADHKCPLKCFEVCPSCDYKVVKRRKCGHKIAVQCSSDPNEKLCVQRCKKIMSCGHFCKGLCKDPCNKCMVMVSKVIAECGHKIQSECSAPVNRSMCKLKCSRTLPCGHNCTNLCKENCTSKCLVLINSKIRPGCGHSGQIPCYKKDAELDPYSPKLLQYCREPCTAILKCDHKCTGTCGECLQGRIHKICQEKCGQILICGHSCEMPCSKACEPCTKKCTYKCEHSKCGKVCGDLCKPCSEPCTRRCLHVRCSKLCGQICDVEPCKEPCQKLIKCGHSCMGYCNEECPDLCRVCNPDHEAFNVFLGYEEELDSRFVVLKDCNHIIESKGMEMWIAQTVEKREIHVKTCPMCKTPINKTQRYANYTKQINYDITNIKRIFFGISEENENLQTKLIEQIDGFKNKSLRLVKKSHHFLIIVNKLKISLQPVLNQKRVILSKITLRNISNMVNIIEQMVNYYCSVEKEVPNETACLRHLDILLGIIGRQNQRLSNQQIDEMLLELNRFSALCEFTILQNKCKIFSLNTNEDIIELCNAVCGKFRLTEPFYEETKREIDDMLKKLSTKVNYHKKLSAIEMAKIVKAVGVPKGHWFTCPDGHYYCIGECGGAMQISKCPECGKQIGGTNHRLLDDNQHAREIDGSDHPAWSEQANLQNYIF